MLSSVLLHRWPVGAVLLGVLLALCGSGPVQGADLVVSRALFEDRHGTLGIAEVVDEAFHEIGQVTARGFTDSVHWLRVVVRAPQGGGPVELRVRPTFLDEVVVYAPDPLRPGGWIAHTLGDRHGSAARAASVLGLKITPGSRDATTTYYLRIKTTSSSLFHVEALAPDAARLSDVRRQAGHVLYLALLGAVAVLALNELAVLRQRLALVFLFYLTVQIGQSLAVNGYLLHLLPSGQAAWADPLTSLLVLGTVAAGACFYRQLFKAYAAARIGVRLLEGAVLLFFVELALMLAGQARLALQINAQVLLAIGLCLPVIAMSMRGGPAGERRTIRWLVYVQTGALVLSLTPLMGLFRPDAEWVFSIALAHGVITAAAMYAIVHFRAQAVIQARKKMELDLVRANEQLHAERTRVDEQSRFMDMLTHELKTPISALRMVFGLAKPSAQAREHALRALADMDSVIERCRQMDQLEQGQLRPHREACRIDAVLEEVLALHPAPGRLRVVCDPVPVIESDRHLLKIILCNLLDNALKYSAPGSEVEASLALCHATERARIRFAIENTPGPAGFPDPDRLFDKYYRSPEAHRYTGSGLGLYLVRHLAERLAGSLAYEQSAQRVRFTLWLPA